MVNMDNTWISHGKAVVGPTRDPHLSYPTSHLTSPSRIHSSDFYDLGTFEFVKSNLRV